MANGIPSNWRHMAATAGQLASVTANLGTAAVARSVNNVNAS
jgi:hypothetical protein